MAAHAQSNEGDVSPNTKGPICVDTGKPCDYKTSTCNGRVSLLVNVKSRHTYVSFLLNVSHTSNLYNPMLILARL